MCLAGSKRPASRALVTRPLEESIAQNKNIHPGTAADFGIRSTSLPGLSIVTVQLAENIRDTKTQFSDINLKLDSLNARLPQGAGPIQFLSDFGDTAALMLTVASPPADDVEIALRAREVERAIRAIRPRRAARRRGSRWSISSRSRSRRTACADGSCCFRVRRKAMG